MEAGIEKESEGERRVGGGTDMGIERKKEGEGGVRALKID